MNAVLVMSLELDEIKQIHDMVYPVFSAKVPMKSTPKKEGFHEQQMFLKHGYS